MEREREREKKCVQEDFNRIDGGVVWSFSIKNKYGKFADFASELIVKKCAAERKKINDYMIADAVASMSEWVSVTRTEVDRDIN